MANAYPVQAIILVNTATAMRSIVLMARRILALRAMVNALLVKIIGTSLKIVKSAKEIGIRLKIAQLVREAMTSLKTVQNSQKALAQCRIMQAMSI